MYNVILGAGRESRELARREQRVRPGNLVFPGRKALASERAAECLRRGESRNYLCLSPSRASFCACVCVCVTFMSLRVHWRQRAARWLDETRAVVCLTRASQCDKTRQCSASGRAVLSCAYIYGCGTSASKCVRLTSCVRSLIGVWSYYERCISTEVFDDGGNGA